MSGLTWPVSRDFYNEVNKDIMSAKKFIPVTGGIKNITKEDVIDFLCSDVGNKALNRFLERRKRMAEEKKFIYISNPVIDKYLTWKSEQTRKSKAELVREAIEIKIRQDHDFNAKR